MKNLHRPNMRIERGTVAWLLVVATCLLWLPEARAASRVQMVIVVSSGLPPTSTHDLYRLLVSLGVDDLQIRSASPGDKPGIETSASAAGESYRVTAVLTARGDLQLPGARLSPRDAAGLRSWLTKLRSEGPARAAGGPRLPFGLTPGQLARVQAELARPVDFATLGQTPRAVLDRLGAQLGLPLVAEAMVAERLGPCAALSVELQSMARGTALAYVLSTCGLALGVQASEGHDPELRVVEAGSAAETWPIGRQSEKPDRELLPGMVELRRIEIDDIPLAQLLEVIAQRLKCPLLLDQAGITRARIDVAAARVTIAPGQSMYAIVLRRALFASRLKYEVRVDDAGRPLLWITPVIPAAAKDDR